MGERTPPLRIHASTSAMSSLETGSTRQLEETTVLLHVLMPTSFTFSFLPATYVARS
jgi:hypothetical protein